MKEKNKMVLPNSLSLRKRTDYNWRKPVNGINEHNRNKIINRENHWN